MLYRFRGGGGVCMPDVREGGGNRDGRGDSCLVLGKHLQGTHVYHMHATLHPTHLPCTTPTIIPILPNLSHLSR